VRDPALIALYTAVCSLSYTAREADPHLLPHEVLAADNAVVFGRVAGDCDARSGRMRFVVDAESLHLSGLSYRTQTRMLVDARVLDPTPKVGDIWSLAGSVSLPRGLRNPGGFDQRAHYRRSGVRYLLKCRKQAPHYIGHRTGAGTAISEMASRTRAKIRTVFADHIRGEEAALLSALLLGERSAVDTSTLNAFTEAGVLHILAVSGLHVGVIWLALVVLLRVLRAPRRFLLVTATVAIAGYSLLVGHRPPVVRAAVVLGTFAIAGLTERELDSINVLCVAAFVILLFNPYYVFDAGYQLSFMCAMSIIRIYGPARSILSRLHSSRRGLALRWLCASLIVSGSAQLGSAPLVMYHFNRVAIATVAANLLVVPLASVDLCLGMVVSALGSLHRPLAGLVGAASWLSLRLTLASARLFSMLPFSSIWVSRPRTLWMLVWYSLLLLLPTLRRSRKARFASVLVLLVGLNLEVWDYSLSPPAPALTAAFLDVGQGDCSVLRTRSGKTLVVDAGPAYGPTNSGEATLGPYLREHGVRKLDALLLTHPHNDHIGGMDYILDNFKVDLVLDAGVPTRSKSYLRFLEKVRNRGIEYRVLRKGVSFWIGDCRADVLHPDDRTAAIARALPAFNPNDFSIVLKVTCGSVSVLLPGDIDKRARAVFRSVGEIQMLKAPHHGSANSNRAILENDLVPSAVIFSVGRGNRFGFPSEGIVAGYEAAGAQVFRTDRDGCTFFSTDGTGCSVTSVAQLQLLSPFRRFLRGYRP
jgi:competence protein ComEC